MVFLEHVPFNSLLCFLKIVISQLIPELYNASLSSPLCHSSISFTSFFSFCGFFSFCSYVGLSFVLPQWWNGIYCAKLCTWVSGRPDPVTKLWTTFILNIAVPCCCVRTTCETDGHCVTMRSMLLYRRSLFKHSGCPCITSWSMLCSVGFLCTLPAMAGMMVLYATVLIIPLIICLSWMYHQHLLYHNS
jgi:hypothetical protein